MAKYLNSESHYKLSSKLQLHCPFLNIIKLEIFLSFIGGHSYNQRPCFKFIFWILGNLSSFLMRRGHKMPEEWNCGNVYNSHIVVTNVINKKHFD